MGKYAYVKIEYYIISQRNELVNRFFEKYFIFSKIFIFFLSAIVLMKNKGKFFFVLASVFLDFSDQSLRADDCFSSALITISYSIYSPSARSQVP